MSNLVILPTDDCIEYRSRNKVASAMSRKETTEGEKEGRGNGLKAIGNRFKLLQTFYL